MVELYNQPLELTRDPSLGRMLKIINISVSHFPLRIFSRLLALVINCGLYDTSTYMGSVTSEKGYGTFYTVSNLSLVRL